MRFRVEVEPRFDYGRARARDGHPRARRRLPLARAHALARRVGRARAPQRRRLRRVHARAGESATFVLETAPETGVPRRFSEDETRRDFEETVGVLAPLALAVALQGPLARDGAPLGADAEAPDVPADGRDRRRADDEPARADRRRRGTGTTATPGSATRRSRSTRCSASASPRRRPGSWTGSPTASASAWGASPGRSRSCTGSTAARTSSRRCSTHLEGYLGSSPVRIGNGAADQLQLDIYGELIDSVYLYNKYGSAISHAAWADLSRIVEWVCENWDQADEGIWEVARRPPALHVLAADVLGRGRARGPDRPPARAARRHRPLAVDPRRDLPPDHGQGLARRSAAPSSSTTTPTCSTRRCC